MSFFRVVLVMIFVAIAGYTGIVVANHGMGLFSVFFGDMQKLTWAGQLNLDLATCDLVGQGRAQQIGWRESSLRHHCRPGMAFGFTISFSNSRIVRVCRCLRIMLSAASAEASRSRNNSSTSLSVSIKASLSS